MNSTNTTKRNQGEVGWWVEIITQSPFCTYYFGAFDTLDRAEIAKSCYVEALEQDGACGISTRVQQGSPTNISHFEDEGRESSVVIIPPTIKWRFGSQHRQKLSR